MIYKISVYVHVKDEDEQAALNKGLQIIQEDMLTAGNLINIEVDEYPDDYKPQEEVL